MCIRDRVTDTTFRKENGLDQRPIIAILPGSRKQEISKMLEVMLSIVEDFKDYQFVIAGAPSQNESFYQPFIKTQNIHLLLNKTYDLLSFSYAALVTSGTATLETALFSSKNSSVQSECAPSQNSKLAVDCNKFLILFLCY